MYQYRQILVHMRSGDSDREIARRGLAGRDKAGELRQLAHEKGWLDKSRPLPDDTVLAQDLVRTPPPTAVSSVEPYREDVERWFEQGIYATTIHEALQRKHGYEGSYSSVRRFVQRLSKASGRSATVILDFAPGESAQVDFGQGPKVPGSDGEPVKTWFFVMTLAWSRHQYAEVVLDQTVETWLACHRRAFEFFGAVPQKVRIDNAKCAITRACSRDPEVQRAYAELAEGYGFTIDPCAPRDPKKKGRVEAGVKYLKRSFMPLRDFRDLADANRQLHAWVLGEAGNRIHGTTHQRPLTRFAESEKVLLQPLPGVAPEPAAWKKVKLHTDCHVRFEKNRYSAPYTLIGETLWLRATPTAVHVFRDHGLVATHPRLRGPGERSTVDDHLPPEALAFKRQDAPWCRERAAEIGPSCRGLIDELLHRDRLVDQLRAAQSVLRLAKSYCPTRLEAACQRASSFGDVRFRTVQTILEKGLDQVVDEDVLAPLAAAYTGAGRFNRDLKSILQETT
jgi:transposase